MPSSWSNIDTQFPSFTGKESVNEKIETIQNYMFLLVEQMRYTLRNLDLRNMNPAAVDKLSEMIEEDIFSENGYFAKLMADEAYIYNLFAHTIMSDEIITNNLYALNGNIANLVVNCLRTDYMKAWKFLNNDSSPVNYKFIYNEWDLDITATVPDPEQKEQHKNMIGELLWWKDGEIGTYMVTDVSKAPVEVYKYEEIVKHSSGFEEVTMSDGQQTVMPVETWGAGTGYGNFAGKFKMWKDLDGMRMVQYGSPDETVKAILDFKYDGKIYYNGNELATVGSSGGGDIHYIDHMPTEPELEQFNAGERVSVYDRENPDISSGTKTLFPVTHDFYVVEVTPPPPEPFSITVNSGDDASFILPTSGRLNNTNNSYKWIIDWGDGTTTNENGIGTEESGISHNYPQADTLYKIKIKPQDEDEQGWLRAFGFSGFTTGGNVQSNKNKVVLVDGQLTEQMIRTSPDDYFILVFTFFGCNNLEMGERFQLPQELTTVGDSFCALMFYDCTSLTMNNIFTLPQNLITVRSSFCEHMFQNCTNLTMNDIFTLPQDISSVGIYFCHSMFEGCTNLTMNNVFQLPQNLTTVGTYFCYSMFRNCTNLTMNDIFTLPQNLITVGSNFCYFMFQYCTNLTMNDIFTLPQNLITVGTHFCSTMFHNCTNLTMNNVFQLPQNLTIINIRFCQNLFRDCTNLTNGVIRFFGSLVLSQNDIDTIDAYYSTFANCTSLTESLSTIPQLQIVPNTRRYTFSGCSGAIIAPLHANWK